MQILFQKIATPRVFVPTSNIKIQTGETLQVDGTLVVNGSLIGGGLPQPDVPATGISNLNDVEISNLEAGQALKWDGQRWVNLDDEKGLSELSIDGLNGVQIDAPTNGQALKWNGVHWVNTTDESGVENLTQLSDTSIQNIQQGQILQWNGTNWVNITQTVSTTLQDLEDTNISNPENLSVLQYDSASQKWNAVGSSDFIDSIIDAGYSDADLHYVDAFDIDGGFA